MNSVRLLRYARRSAAMTQRQLAASAGLPQSTVARIESGRLQPRWETMTRLLHATGHSLEISTAGAGIDRSQIRAMLRLTPRQRLETASADARGLGELLERAGRGHRTP
jgi:predicted transcriptional regulator